MGEPAPARHTPRDLHRLIPGEDLLTFDVGGDLAFIRAVTEVGGAEGLLFAVLYHRAFEQVCSKTPHSYASKSATASKPDLCSLRIKRLDVAQLSHWPSQSRSLITFLALADGHPVTSAGQSFRISTRSAPRCALTILCTDHARPWPVRCRDRPLSRCALGQTETPQEHAMTKPLIARAIEADAPRSVVTPQAGGKSEAHLLPKEAYSEHLQRGGGRARGLGEGRRRD